LIIDHEEYALPNKVTPTASPTPVPGDRHSVPIRSWKCWAALAAGVAFVGIGIGFMIEAGLGVSPLDAFFSGAASQSGFSMGIVLGTFSVAMVLVAWMLGIRPAIGTLISALGIGVFIDLVHIALQPVMPAAPPIASLFALWFLGLAIFCVGVLCLFASDLGASPYDQLTKAVAKVFRVSLGASRIILDGVALALAFLLGGAWGVGTLILLLTVPFVLNRALPLARRIIRGAVAPVV
jgi:uncharacterized membrane protein YczE